MCIGISGWQYAPWRGVFYPKKLVHRQELAFASRALPSIEINGTFYSLQKPASFARWFDETPDDFVFSIKAPRLITHIRRLKDAHQAVADFFASGLLGLRHKLGPILWQLPPSLRFDAGLIDAFLHDLPRDTHAAHRLAHGYGPDTGEPRALRHAMEVRHKSFAVPAFVELLRRHGVALVVADTAGKWPCMEDVTADFIYMRLHGDVELYASGYSDDALHRWAERIVRWSNGAQPDDARLVTGDVPARRAHRDIYCYFDNDIKVHAPFDAAALLGMLGRPSDLGAYPSDRILRKE